VRAEFQGAPEIRRRGGRLPHRGQCHAPIIEPQSKLKLMEMPDWQNVTLTVKITSPPGA
jgi:hypothetical protein